MTYVKFTYLDSLFNYLTEMKVEVIKDIIKERLQKYCFASINASNARARKARVSFSIGMQIR